MLDGVVFNPGLSVNTLVVPLYPVILLTSPAASPLVICTSLFTYASVSASVRLVSNDAVLGVASLIELSIVSRILASNLSEALVEPLILVTSAETYPPRINTSDERR